MSGQAWAGGRKVKSPPGSKARDPNLGGARCTGLLRAPLPRGRDRDWARAEEKTRALPAPQALD